VWVDVSHRRLAAGLESLQFSATESVPIEDLVLDDFVRYGGEDPRHSAALAATSTTWPPIFVHRESMRIIDGLHRAYAARRRGDRLIDVCFVSGSRADVFVLAVRANTAHGKPLSLAERERSARQILATHQRWSDQAIASVCGLSARTVASLRSGLSTPGATMERRIGRDGRVRAAAPDTSLRAIARQVGLSPATVKDVRDRVERGESPEARSRAGAGRSAPGEAPGGDRQATELLSDAALQSIPDQGDFTSWMAAHVVEDGDWRSFVGAIPVSRVYVVADSARACAASWRAFADELESRIKGRRAG
jgi:ParB-like chromosome segregation protein Spo0J